MSVDTELRRGVLPELEDEQEIDFGRYWRALAVRWWLPLAGLVVAAIAGVAVGLYFSLPTAGALVLAFGVAAGAAKVAFDSIVQRETPEAARGWAFARFESYLQLAWVAGALAPLAVSIPAGAGVLGAGAAAALLAILYTVGRHRVRSAALP